LAKTLSAGPWLLGIGGEMPAVVNRPLR